MKKEICSSQNERLTEALNYRPTGCLYLLIEMDYTEEYGITPIHYCSGCLRCKQCSFQNYQVSYEEQEELKLIKKFFHYDGMEKQWYCNYPLKEDPSVISDTKAGATKMLKSVESQLVKACLEKQYASQIEDWLSRKVIRAMTPGKKEEHPVGYWIPHNWMEKPDSKSTTTPTQNYH
jgi:hypothetical protein